MAGGHCVDLKFTFKILLPFLKLHSVRKERQVCKHVTFLNETLEIMKRSPPFLLIFLECWNCRKFNQSHNYYWGLEQMKGGIWCPVLYVKWSFLNNFQDANKHSLCQEEMLLTNIKQLSEKCEQECWCLLPTIIQPGYKLNDLVLTVERRLKRPLPPYSVSLRLWSWDCDTKNNFGDTLLWRRPRSSIPLST